LNAIKNTKNTLLIRTKAKELGFDEVGISKAEFLEQEAPRLEKWLKESRHGKMSYMENHFDKRLDPTLLVDGAKSVISFSLNYYPEKLQTRDSYKISKYAYGQDYHHVIKDKLKQLLQFINQEIGDVNGRGFVDSAPVMDKAWAKKSGIGWLGKNNNLITRESGSFFFIAELILDLELDEDSPTNDYCGTCTKCIDACPTEAIYEDHKVDGSKCISYLTIELKDALLPNSFANKMDDWMFGCDICQDVCPWNKFSTPTKEAAFAAHPSILNNSKSDWEEITQEIFSEIFRKSAVKRTKYDGLKRNIEFLTSK
jgi:epoxyqueuosine reductase